MATPKTQKRTLIPEDFKVSERIVELAKENRWPDPYKEVDAFRDYHMAHGSLMADWEAAFRTWLRNCLRFNKAAPQPVPAKRAAIFKEDKREISWDEQRVRLRAIVGGIGK